MVGGFHSSFFCPFLLQYPWCTLTTTLEQVRAQGKGELAINRLQTDRGRGRTADRSEQYV